jgi:hypothetical protein
LAPTFHKSFIKLPGQVVGTTEKYNHQPSFAKNQLSTLLYLSHIYIPNHSSGPSQLSAHHLFPPSLLPPSLINTAPFLTIIRTASFLHSITPLPREKPPHASSAAVMKRFQLQK